MNPLSNHTTAMAQHREYETRYGGVGRSPAQASSLRTPSAFSLLAVLSALSVVTHLL